MVHSIKDIKKALLIVITLLSVVAISADLGMITVEKVTTEQAEPEEPSEKSYVQAFDVVPQNVQFQLDLPSLPEVRSFEILSSTIEFFRDSFDITATPFYRILFRLIIATNAP